MIFDEEKYKTLCNFCDKVILSSKDNQFNSFIYISWLHIINEHPNFLATYNYLFFKNRFRIFIFLFGKLTYFIFSWLLHLFLAIKIKSFGLFNTIKKHKKIDIVIISHLNSIDSLKVKKDFYFGNLHNEIELNGFSTLIVYLNKTKKNVNNHKSQLQKGLPNKIIL